MRAPITDKHLLEMMWERFPEIMRRGAEQPAQQEPVAWMHEWEDGERIPMLMGRDDRNNDEPKSVRPLVYADTSPQPAQRTWVGLTEDEAFACKGRDYFETYKAIEAKLKEKNT